MTMEAVEVPARRPSRPSRATWGSVDVAADCSRACDYFDHDHDHEPRQTRSLVVDLVRNAGRKCHYPLLIDIDEICLATPCDGDVHHIFLDQRCSCSLLSHRYHNCRLEINETSSNIGGRYNLINAHHYDQ
jgi:hypothetical protein